MIGKVLANRLRPIFQELIHHAQSAFLPSRSLQESFIMAQEMIYGWHKRKCKAFLWKIDFRKAYDSISWPYLWDVLKRRGFPSTWIRWVKRCITTASFTSLINGKLCGSWIQPQCGIRQGCPLAPLIFNLAVDNLAWYACKLAEAGLIRGYSLS